MKKLPSVIISILLIFPAPLFAWKWLDLWLTPDQQGAKLLRAGKAQQAAQVFKNTDWRSVSHYRAGNYVQAYQQFQTKMSSDGQYNAGNAAAFMQQYEKALAAYDKAITLNPNNKDAIFNRDIIKKLLQKQQQQSKNNNQNQNNKNSQSSQQNSAQNNRSQQQDDKQKPNQQNTGNDKQQDKKNPQNSQQNTANNSQQNKNNAGNEKQNAKPNEQIAATNNVQTKDEGKRQLLRRVADDPGGLLKQKFLRDYLRRHSIEQSAAQGDN